MTPRNTDEERERIANLRRQADSASAEVAASVPDLFSALNSDDERTRSYAAKSIEVVAAEVPERLVPEVEELVNAIERAELPVVQRLLSRALTYVADEFPERVAEHHQLLAHLLSGSSSAERLGGAGAMMGIANADTSAVRPHLEDLASLTTDDDTDVRFYAVTALATVAKEEPEAVVPYAEALRNALAFDPDTIKMAFIGLSRVGEEDPTTVEGLEDVIIRALDDQDRTIRVSALRLVFPLTENVKSGTRHPLNAVTQDIIRSLQASDQVERQSAIMAMRDVARGNPDHLPPEGSPRLADAFEQAVAQSSIEVTDLNELLRRIESPHK